MIRIMSIYRINDFEFRSKQPEFNYDTVNDIKNNTLLDSHTKCIDMDLLKGMGNRTYIEPIRTDGDVFIRTYGNVLTFHYVPVLNYLLDPVFMLYISTFSEFMDFVKKFNIKFYSKTYSTKCNKHNVDTFRKYLEETLLKLSKEIS